MEAVTAAVVAWAKAKAAGWLARNWKKLVGLGALAMACVVLLGVSLTSTLGEESDDSDASNSCRTLGYEVDQDSYQPAPVDATPTVPSGGTVAGFGPGEDEQIANAKTIIAAGKKAKVGTKGYIIAIATALQESGLRNLKFGDRDSLGLFQQRPSQGWGTAAQVTNPTYAALAFYGGKTSPHYNKKTHKASPGGLWEVGGWQTMSVTVAAQSVQRSAFPDAYARQEARATTIVKALAGDTTTVPAAPSTGDDDSSSNAFTVADWKSSGVDIASYCFANFKKADASSTDTGDTGETIPAGKWTAPLKARMTSPFGMRFHPVLHIWRLHAGTDFHATVGTPIAAASSGIVHSVSWDSGGGLHVQIAHADHIDTLYLHLSKSLVKPGDKVKGGQVIALSGDSGLGTGPHFHYEVHVNGTPVDPVPFMAQRGVDLRAWS